MDGSSNEDALVPDDYECSDFTRSLIGALDSWEENVEPEEAYRRHLAEKYS